MNNNEALHLFVALRLHFTTKSYDFFRYNGQLRQKLDFEQRNDKFQIKKIAQHPDPQGLIVANFISNPNLKWTGDIISEEGMARYREWKKRQEALTYTFSEEIKKLKENFDSNLKVDGGQHPYALKLYLGEHIFLETLVIINDLTPFWPYWDKEMRDDIVWKQIRLQIPKYAPFVVFDRDNCKAILLKHFAG
jgi:T4 gene Gp59 loader of gp41 DNA helicase C-term